MQITCNDIVREARQKAYWKRMKSTTIYSWKPLVIAAGAFSFRREMKA
jgi:hypothetical protein